jgi:hypothetical protein
MGQPNSIPRDAVVIMRGLSTIASFRSFIGKKKNRCGYFVDFRLMSRLLGEHKRPYLTSLEISKVPKITSGALNRQGKVPKLGSWAADFGTKTSGYSVSRNRPTLENTS